MPQNAAKLARSVSKTIITKSLHNKSPTAITHGCKETEIDRRVAI